MIWPLLGLLSLLVLCLIAAVVTLWQNLGRTLDAAAALGRAISALTLRVNELERSVIDLGPYRVEPKLAHMATLAEKVQREGPMAGPWTNPVSERYPEVQP